MSRSMILLLGLMACNSEGLSPELLGADQAAVPSVGGITLTIPPLYVGETATITVDNAYPGETVYIFTSLRGVGTGPCFDTLGGACMDIRPNVNLAAGNNADADGIATFNLPVPTRLLGASFGVQAAIVHGLRGVDSILSEAQMVTMIERPLDSDGDGVPDAFDVCDGDDATGDTDLDGVCDDLDICPLDAADDGDGDGSCDSDDPCPADPNDACVVSGKLVFLTSTQHTGDLGGVTGADGICQDAASLAGHPGTFKAWLSGGASSSSPSVRFTQSTEPYVRVDGAVVADDWADLTDGTLHNPINVDEYGAAAVTSFAYTYVTTSGGPGLNVSSDCYGGDCHCNDWTNANGQGSPTPGSAVGRVSFTTSQWTDYSFGNFCGPTGYSLYCFEQ